MKYSWDNIRFFLAVADTGSLSGAARKLGSTQPTVGRHINALEGATELRLFDRFNDGFRLTEAGNDLFAVARKMSDAAAEFNIRQAGLAELNGCLRLSSNHQCAPFITQIAPAFFSNFPNVELEFLASQRDANLSQREADLLIRFCIPEFGDLIARKLAVMEFAIYAHSEFVEAHPACLTEQRYGMAEWVHFDADHLTEPGEKWLARTLKSNAILRVSNLHLLQESLRSGIGMGLLPCYLGDRDTSLIRISEPIDEARSVLHLLVHRDLRKSPLIRNAMTFLAEQFSLHSQILLGSPPPAPSARAAE